MELVDKKLQLLEDFSDSISILKSHINPVSIESPLDRLLKIEALKYSLSSLMTLKTDELIIFMMLAAAVIPIKRKSIMTAHLDSRYTISLTRGTRAIPQPIVLF